MIVSISGVVFVNIILTHEIEDLNINILYTGLAIASVIVAGAYALLSGEKVGEKKEKLEVKKREEEVIHREVKLSEPPKKEGEE